jgi:hypothetical protein
MSGPNLDLYKWVNVYAKLGSLIDIDSFVQI